MKSYILFFSNVCSPKIMVLSEHVLLLRVTTILPFPQGLHYLVTSTAIPSTRVCPCALLIVFSLTCLNVYLILIDLKP